MSEHISKKEFDSEFEKYMRTNKKEFEMEIIKSLNNLEMADTIPFLVNDRAINKAIEICKKILKDHKNFYDYLLEMAGIYKILPIEKEYYVKKWYKHFKENGGII